MPDGSLRIGNDPDSGDLLYEREDMPSVPSIEAGEHFQNLATPIEEGPLDTIASMLTELVTRDEESRGPWEDMLAQSYALLGVGPESEEDAEDDEGAKDTSDHPLLLTAITRFVSKALAAMMPSADKMVNYEPAFCADDIKDPKERRLMLQDAHEAGRRVQRFYTDYLKNRLDSYVEDTDQLLVECGLGFQE